MWIIYIFDCLFISEWRISEKTNAWKFKQWNDINARSVWIANKFNPENKMFVFIEHLISECRQQGWSLSKAIRWRKSTRVEMDLLLHFRSGGFVPYFHSLTKRLEFFSTNVVALVNRFEIIFTYLFLWITALCNLVSLYSLIRLLVGLNWNVPKVKFPKLHFQCLMFRNNVYI